MGVMTTKFLGKFGEIVFILRNAFIYRGLRKFLGDCYTLSPSRKDNPHLYEKVEEFNEIVSILFSNSQ